MSVEIKVGDDVLASLKIPLPEIRAELTKELAIALYARWALPLGKARAMCALTKREFLEELASRGIVRHYTERELSEDLDYAEGGE